MGYIHQETTNITEAEWDSIEATLSNTRYSFVTRTLRIQNNKSRPAYEVLPSDIVNQGNEQVNAVLLKQAIPFRLTRIGSYSKMEGRKNRLLAFVRWPQ